MLVSDLVFASLYSYVPGPYGRLETYSDAYNFVIKLKQDKAIESGGIRTPISDAIAKAIRISLKELPFKDFFGESAYLVPAPSHAKHDPRADHLNNVRNIVLALEREGLGQAFDCIERIEAVTKSATANSSHRPDVTAHYHSIRVQRGVHKPQRIVIVDDVVTRGATMLACASRLKETWPDAHIVGFAVVRALSNPNEYTRFRDPCMGTIRLAPGGGTFRQP